jgi:tetratricopeptide (TPR) repeat protein
LRSALLFICLGFLAFGQNTERLRDSIVKYKISNPSLAIEYGIQYTDDDLSKISNSKTVGTHALIGEILLDMGLYASALNYFNRSIELFNSLPESEMKDPVAQPPWVILNIGNIYFQNGDFEKAKVKFKEAKRLFQQFLNIEDKQYGLNTSDSNLALIMESEGDYDSAEKIYQEIYLRRLKSNKLEDISYSIAQLIAVKLHKKEFVAAENKLQELIQLYENQKTPVSKTSILTRNYGYAFLVFAAYYQSIKDYENAIKYLNKSKTILKHFPNEVNALGSRFAECYLGLNDFNTAQEIAKENLKIKNLNEAEKRYNYRVLEKIYKKKGFNSELLKIKDSLILISSGSPSARMFKSLNNLEIQIQLANSARQLNEDRIRYNTYLYILIICSIILFFSLITIRINYNLQKEVGSRLEAEKKLITSELDQKNRELVSKSNFILQRNEYLKKIKSKLESSKQSDNNDLKSASYELNSVINSDKSYKDFDKMFVNVYPDFYVKLNKIAELSSTDLRLASYIKMNHTNSEIAIISGVSSRTIESQRYRLSKKLNLDKDQSLNSFLMSI